MDTSRVTEVTIIRHVPCGEPAYVQVAGRLSSNNYGYRLDGSPIKAVMCRDRKYVFWCPKCLRSGEAAEFRTLECSPLKVQAILARHGFKIKDQDERSSVRA
jgi:hypothetical protein